MQSEKTNIAYAVELQKDLYESTDLEIYKNDIKTRMDQALEPFFFVAKIMHPQYRGQRFTFDEENQAEEWTLTTTKKPEF